MSPDDVPRPAGAAARSAPRRLVVTIALGWVAVLVGWAVALAVSAPSERPGDDAFARGFVDACTRSGGDVDACDCAWERWSAAVPADERRALDEQLAGGGDVPASVREAVVGC